MLGNSDLGPSQSVTRQVSLIISWFRHSGESPEPQILVGYVNRDYMTILLKFDQLYGQLWPLDCMIRYKTVSYDVTTYNTSAFGTRYPTLAPARHLALGCGWTAFLTIGSLLALGLSYASFFSCAVSHVYLYGTAPSTRRWYSDWVPS